MLKLVTLEAQAYLKLGLLAPTRRRVLPSKGGRSATGVLFVPGVGANGAQFVRLKHALEPHVQWFGSFEYFSLRHPKRVARDLEVYVDDLASRVERLVLVGHSLGGLLSSMIVQGTQPPPNLFGWVSICAPLHGTWRSKLAPSPGLRALSPDGALITEVLQTRNRLSRLEGRILTIGARRDQMIQPHTSAFLDGYPSLELKDVAHAGSLFDRSVHRAVAESVSGWLSTTTPTR